MRARCLASLEVASFDSGSRRSKVISAAEARPKIRGTRHSSSIAASAGAIEEAIASSGQGWSPFSEARFPTSSRKQSTRVPVRAARRCGTTAAHASAAGPRARGSSPLSASASSSPPSPQVERRPSASSAGGRGRASSNGSRRLNASACSARAATKSQPRVARSAISRGKVYQKGKTSPSRKSLPCHWRSSSVFPDPGRAQRTRLRPRPRTSERAWRRSSRNSSILPKNRSGSSAPGNARPVSSMGRTRGFDTLAGHKTLVDEFPPAIADNALMSSYEPQTMQAAEPGA